MFPLRPGGTEPAVRDWRSRATTDPERIARAWGASPYNVGIAVCASGLVVLDLVAAAPGERPPLPYRRLQGVVDGADVLALHVENEEARWPTETFTAAGPGGDALVLRPPRGQALSAGDRRGRRRTRLARRRTDCRIVRSCSRQHHPSGPLPAGP
ncbi:hypothetical protein GCM10020000_85550 [Streptomyces olivoverticillatus]